MVSSYTTNKSIEKPANGDYNNTWSVPVNTDWDIIDTAFGGTTNINAVSASGTVTLTTAQYRPPIITITGLLTANVNYQLPSTIGGNWTIFNNTTGAFSIIFSSAGGGSTVTLPQGYTVSVISDGTNIGLSTTNAALISSSYANPAWITSLAASKLTGSVAVTNGGTGGTTQATARSGIGAAASGANTDITSLSSATGLTLSPTGSLILNPSTGTLVGSPTGGVQGVGTINATGLFINGAAVGTGSGSVTSTSVVSANGFAGTVATASTTPAITLTTTITGVLKGNGTAISAATAGTDYIVPGGALGTPSSGTLTNTTGLPISTGVSGLGTSVATALGVNVGSAGAFVTFNGALGTPSSGTLTNCTFPTLNQNTTGSAATLTTARTLTIGATGQTFNGSANVTWTLVQIGAAASGANGDITSLTALTSIPSATTINGVTIGYRSIPRSTTATTAVVGDVGKCIAVTAGITIPNSTFAAGDAISIYNDSAAAVTITAGVTTLRLAGTVSTGNRTLAARGIATVWFNSATEAIISGAGVS